MKYVITKAVKTGRGFTYDHYVVDINGKEQPLIITATMKISEAKIYTSRKAARNDIKLIGDSWTIEPVNP